MQGDGTPIPMYRNESDHMGPTQETGRLAPPLCQRSTPPGTARGTRPGHAAV